MIAEGVIQDTFFHIKLYFSYRNIKGNLYDFLSAPGLT